MINMAERDHNPQKEKDLETRRAAIDLRVAIPGIIQSFNPSEQTVEVKPAIRECLVFDGEEQWTDIPLLVDVPIVLPRAGGYSLTMPIKPGDECLVVFSDMCMDAWWQSGGTQNQVECRRHDLSDGFAIIGTWSQPHIIPNYSTGSAQLRNDAGSAVVEISGSTINIRGSAINLEAPNVTVNGATTTVNSTNLKFNGGGSTTIEGKTFLNHQHSGVNAGTSNTGGVA